MDSDNNQPVSLAPEPQQQDTQVALSDPNTTTPVSPEVANVRAAKAHFGLNPQYTDWSHLQIANAMQQGDEGKFRQMVSQQRDMQKAQDLNFRIRDFTTKAAQAGVPVQPEAIQGIIDANSQPTDPQSIIEEAYSKAYMQGMFNVAYAKDTLLKKAQEADPQAVDTLTKLGERYLQYREYAIKGAQEAQANLEKQSWFGWGIDQLKSIIPGYNDLKLRGTTPGVGYFYGMMGEHFEAESEDMLSRPFPEYKAWFDSNLQRLMQTNPSLAVVFAGAMADRSINNRRLTSLSTTASDLAALPVGTAAKIGFNVLTKTGLMKAAADATTDMVTSAASGEAIKVAQAAGAGDLKEAGLQKAANAIAGEITGRPLDPNMRALEALPTGFRPDVQGYALNPGRFGQEIVNRLTEQAITSSRNVLNTIRDMLKVNRTPEFTAQMASKDVLDKLLDYTQGQYRGVRNSIINIMAPRLDPETKTAYLYDVIFGNENAQYFFNPDVAKTWAKVNGLADAQIERAGAGQGWYVRVTRPVDETHPIVRDLFQTTAASQSPARGLNAWFNAMVGRWRTPEETLSLNQRENRKVATYGPAILLRMASNEIKEVKNLKGWALKGTDKLEKWKQWKTAIDRARDMRDENGEPGYFFRSPGELEQHYQTWFQRRPDPQEIGAYFAYTRFVEMDRALRNILLWKHKSRVGIATHRLNLSTKGGTQATSEWFDGKILDKMPWTEHQTLVAIGKNKDNMFVRWGNGFNTKLKREIEEGIHQGRYKVIELWDPESRPLNGFSTRLSEENPRIRYVITNKLESKGLSYDQVPRRGGGHFDFEAEHYIKQARVTPLLRKLGLRDKLQSFKYIYEGDTTAAALMNRAIGVKLVPFMNQARELLKAGDSAAAKDIVEKNLPWEWDEFRRSFYQSKDADGTVHPPRFNLNEEFKVVPRNQLIGKMDTSLADKYGHNFEDGTITGSLARQHQVAYTGERDVDVLKQINDVGSKSNPVFKLEQAPLVDPVTSINRAMSRIINSSFMDDYKIFSVEHWLKDAAKWLKPAQGDNIDAIWKSPYWYFNNAKDKAAFQSGAPPEIVNRLLGERMQMQQFMGLPSNMDAMLHSASEKLADTFYNNFGPSKLDPSWMLYKIRDPIRFLRSVTFHAKIGLFSLPQLFVHLNMWTNILAVAGIRNTMSGTVGAYMHQLSRLNPSMIGKLDELASSLRLPGLSSWKPGELEEAQQAMARTGFETVGGEYQLRDDALAPKMITSGLHQFLDWGTMFFKEGERNTRISAWYTAYREFRDKSPTGRLTDQNIQSILNRADDLSINMSRASASRLNTGVFAIPTQFLAYQMRLIELFTGKRMGTGWEGVMNRARMFSWYSAIYGLPSGLALGGFPIGDYFRKTALDNNYVVGDNYITSMFMEGIPSLVGALVTGQGDIKKGIFFNPGNRYGVHGFDPLRDSLRSDETMWDLIGGAAFSTLKNTIENTDGFVNGMMSFLRDDDKYFPLKSDDFIDPFKEISSVNNAWRLIAALNTGRWLSKKNVYVDDTTPLAAIFQSITGMQPQEIDDLQMVKAIQSDQKEYEKYIESRAEQEFKKAVRSWQDNPTQATDYFKRALTWLNIGDYPQAKRPAFISRASKDDATLIDQTDWNFVKQGPEDQMPGRFEAWKDKAHMRQLRGQ